jgi:hypothetical protein
MLISVCVCLVGINRLLALDAQPAPIIRVHEPDLTSPARIDVLRDGEGITLPAAKVLHPGTCPPQ